MVNILFVCSGDSCRSPMMTSVFMHFINETGLSGVVTATSAGINATEKTVNNFTIVALNEFNIASVSHTPTQLTLEMLDEFDFVITATSEIKEIITKVKKINNIKSFAEFTGVELSDPYGRGRGAYLETARRLVENMKVVLEKLISLGVIK